MLNRLTRWLSGHRPVAVAAWSVCCSSLVVGAGSEAAVAAPLTYTQTFTHTGASEPLTGTAQAGVADYFHVTSSGGAWELGTGNWGGAPNTLNAKSNNAATTYVERSLYDGGVLGAGQALSSFSITVDSEYYWGANADGTLRSLVGLLNAEGDGYVAAFWRRGRLTIYRIDGGMAGTRTTLKEEATLALDTTTNPKGYQKATFSLSGTTLTLSTVDRLGNSVGSVSTTLSGGDFTNFTTIVLGSVQGGNETNYFHTLELTGQILPEPGAAALLGLAGVMMLHRPYRR